MSDQLRLSPTHRVVRIAGAVLLTGCVVMLVLGMTVLDEWLQGRRFVLYWTWCFVVTFAAIVTAGGDAVLLARASRRTRCELFHGEFMGRPFRDKSTGHDSASSAKS